MNTLKAFAIGAEVTVISTLAVSSYNAAFVGTGAVNLLAGAPLIAVMALESLRLPIAFNLTKARLSGLLMSGAMLAGLSVITTEAATMAFTNLISQRVRPVVEAEAELKKVSITRDTLSTVEVAHAQDIAQAKDDLKAARDHRAEIDKPITLQALPPSKTCSHMVGAGKYRRWVSYDCSTAQNDAERGNRNTQALHDAELKAASDLVAAAQKRLTEIEAQKTDMHASNEEVEKAEQKVADARMFNPMYQLAAAWQKVPAQELTPDQFEYVRHWAVIALATATAFTTSLVAVISSLPPRGAKGDGKLARAVRAYIARRRKRLVRLVPGPFRDRVKMVYVPVDVTTGKVLDPDKTQGSTPNFKLVQ